MSDDNYDDGLVHGHGWAREAMPEGITRLVAPVARLHVPANDTAQAMNAHPEDAHDDGLVHNHAWAQRNQGPIASP